MKKIVVFEQDNCGWCIRLHPHVEKLASDFEVPMEIIKLENEPDSFKKYNFRTTPTVVIFDDDVAVRKFELDARTGISTMVSEIREFVK